MVPFCAVTTIFILVTDPAVSDIAPDAEPEDTDTPFTVMLDAESVAVGVTVIDEVPLDSPDTLYELVPERKEGLNVPDDTERLDSVLIDESADVVKAEPEAELVSLVDDVSVSVGV